MSGEAIIGVLIAILIIVIGLGPIIAGVIITGFLLGVAGIIAEKFGVIGFIAAIIFLASIIIFVRKE